MDCRDFLRATTIEERQRVAALAGTTVGYLKQIAGRHSRPSADLAVRLEEASGRRMTREELLPEIFVRQPSAAGSAVDSASADEAAA